MTSIIDIKTVKPTIVTDKRLALFYTMNLSKDLSVDKELFSGERSSK
jgi:hypothetical protein